MRIVHVINSLDPDAGGPPMVAARLAAGQAILGHEVTIATYEWPDREEATRRAHEALPSWSSVGIEWIPTPNGRLDRVLARGATTPLTKLVNGADVVHLHSLWQPILLRASRICRERNVPYLVCPHGTLDPWSLQQSKWKKKLALSLAFRRMLNGAAALHLLNRDEVRLIEPLGLRSPAVIIPNGVFFEEMEPLPKPGSFHAARPELNGAAYVLFLSRLHYKKGPEYLADAFAMIAPKHPDLHLVVAGPDGGSRAGLEQQIAAQGLTDRVHLTGAIYGADKYAALVDATCFCLPSWQEGFSVAITEALACGLPVVITEGCHFPEVAEVGAGEVVERDRQQVADALDRVLTDRGLRQRMGAAGRELIESRFTWTSIAEQSVAAYERAGPDHA